ncbi:hypothetical protein [Corynebacterium sp. CCM 9203]|uniref:hypothetical protein n=1 Tax=Corynebacterium sp. CCM 9203 TaxID=3057615 RepID=UPI003526BE86
MDGISPTVRPAAVALPALEPDVSNSHPGGHPNSPAWLLGHAARIVSDDQEGLTGYLIAACSAAARYAGSLRNGQWAEIVDDSYDPPVTRATRLVSILDDAAQHVGQVAYVAGMSS